MQKSKRLIILKRLLGCSSHLGLVVKILNVSNDKVSLTDSEFSHEDLFLDMKEPSKSNVFDLVGSRIESGFYNRVLTKADYVVDDRYKIPSYKPKKIDGTTLVDYLNEAGIVKKPKPDNKVDIPNQTNDMNSKVWAARASVKIEQVDSTLFTIKDSVNNNPIPDEDNEVAFHKTIFGPSDSVLLLLLGRIQFAIL